MAEEASSSSSSHLEYKRMGTSQESSFKAEDPPKATYVEAFELEEAPAECRSRLQNRASEFKRRHTKFGRVIDYIRGPRPPIDLPDPTPLLDREYNIKQSRISVHLESPFIRVTRPLGHTWIFILFVIAWIIGFSFLTRQQSFLIPAEYFTTCTATFWSRDAGCGLNGEGCLPFDNATFSGRCPAQCDSVQLLNPRVVGNEEIVFKPLIVGGGDAQGTYRGDSFICAAAIHAGAIDNRKGGCFDLQLTGNFTDFIGSTANGLTSIGFPSVFPLSFRVTPNNTLGSCTDIQVPVLAFNVIITAILTLLLRPKPIVLFWSLVCIGYWHISLFSDPRSQPPLISDAFGSFLPLLFVCYAFWRLAIRFVLPPFILRAPIETTILFLGPFWVGVLSNRTFEMIPLQRFTPEDIKKQPGALVAVIILVIVLVVLGVNQARVIRKTGYFPRYAAWYIAGGLTMMILALLPSLEFRLHHYILAMAIIPATAFPTRVSLIVQGAMLGLFMEGIAAYDFDSIVQTTAELIGDAAQGTLLPSLLTNSSTYNTTLPLVNQTLSWAPLPTNDSSWDGFALLVDDVQRYAGAALNFSLASLTEGIPHFFRLAFTNGDNVGDFTMAASLYPNGTWVDPIDGAS